MTPREHKDRLYEQLARMGKALASPKRLEMLDLLQQSEHTVEALASALEMDVKLASAHLRTLREAHLVEAHKSGRFVHYRPAVSAANPAALARVTVSLRALAQAQLEDLQCELQAWSDAGVRVWPLDRAALLERARTGEIVLLDVRPRAEFDTAHLPHARSIPLDALEQRLAELPRDVEVVAYCRGPFCLFSDQALHILRRHGRSVCKLTEGVPEWRAAGLPLECTSAA